MKSLRALGGNWTCFPDGAGRFFFSCVRLLVVPTPFPLALPLFSDGLASGRPAPRVATMALRVSALRLPPSIEPSMIKVRQSRWGCHPT